MEDEWALQELMFGAERAWTDLRLWAFPAAPSRASTWNPAIDVIESEKDLHITIDVPGVRVEDLRLSVAGDRIFLEGMRQPFRSELPVRFIRKETLCGPFSLMLRLPAWTDPGRAEAVLKDGCLSLRLPKRAQDSGARTERMRIPL